MVAVEVEETLPSRAVMLEDVEEEEEAEGERPWAGRWGERIARRRLGCMVSLLESFLMEAAGGMEWMADRRRGGGEDGGEGGGGGGGWRRWRRWRGWVEVEARSRDRDEGEGSCFEMAWGPV